MSTADQDKDTPVNESSKPTKDGKPSDMSYYRDSLQNPIMDEDTLQKQLMTITVTNLETEGECEDLSEPQKMETDEQKKPEKSGKVDLFNRFTGEILEKAGHITTVLLLVLLFTGAGLSGTVVSNSLHHAMQISNSEAIPVIVVLKEQYDNQKLYMETQELGRAERRQFVIEKLTAFSTDTQAHLRPQIDQMSKDGLVSDVRYLWISNVIGMKATIEALTILENHPDIARIEHDPLRQLLPINTHDTDFLPERRDLPKKRINREIAQNVALINAPAVWAQGFTGNGVIVGVIDSGVNYNHTDLAGQLWIHPDYPNHGFNLIANNHDTSDGHGHGTHCAGIVAGDGVSGIHTGVAPECSIMILKVVDAAGNGTQQYVWNAVQFAILNGADVISLSLGWQYAWNPDRSMWRSVMTNALSAGISSAVAT
ncbi:MAG: S8 family serine peptidase, partial [Candidatus Cloacimonadaceae bacterium]|nr:S8 family serine peptidase [Candidatus Cloacimonadaceae bacterium]